MSKMLESLEGKLASPRDVLDAYGLFIPEGSVQEYMKMVEKRDRWSGLRQTFLSKDLVLVLGLIAIPSLILGGMLSYLSWEWSPMVTWITGMGHLSLSSCLIIGGVFAGLVFSSIVGRVTYDAWPRWTSSWAHTASKEYFWYDAGHRVRHFPPEVISVIDRVKMLSPDAMFSVRSYGSDPILSARIEGIDHDIYIWDE